MSYLVYVLYSTQNSNLTYCGSTNNFTRRLNQHNGKLSGGAKYTHKARPWDYFFRVEGFQTKNQALSFEWHMKHYGYRRVRKGGMANRVINLLRVSQKFNIPLSVEWNNNKIEYRFYLENDLPANFTEDIM